jgi:hypothetical protein
MEKRRIITRGKLTYYITDVAVVVGIGKHQFISYNMYNSTSRSNLAEFRKKILDSKPNQYDNVIDQMDLARKFKLAGTGTVRPRWEEDE